MNEVIKHWFCFLQDDLQNHTVREVYLMKDNTIKYRSNDIDGETRYYSALISEFEYLFKVNISEIL